MEYDKDNKHIASNNNTVMEIVKDNSMTAASEPTYISTREAAARAGVHPITINRWMRLGLFGGKRKDRRGSVVNKNDFERYLAELNTSTNHSTA